MINYFAYHIRHYIDIYDIHYHMTATEDQKYLKMLAQMGLAAEQVPSDMRDTLYEKLGLQRPGAASGSATSEAKKLKPEVAEKKRQARRAKEKEERKQQV